MYFFNIYIYISYTHYTHTHASLHFERISEERVDNIKSKSVYSSVAILRVYVRTALNTNKYVLVVVSFCVCVFQTTKKIYSHDIITIIYNSIVIVLLCYK